jgi:hypothetical protein
MFILFSIVIWYGYQVVFLLGPHYAQVLVDGMSCFAESIPENIILVTGTIVAFYVSSDLERYVIATVLSARQSTVAAKAPIPGQVFQTQIQQHILPQPSLPVSAAPSAARSSVPQQQHQAVDQPSPPPPQPLAIPKVPQAATKKPASAGNQPMTSRSISQLLSTLETSKKHGNVVKQLLTNQPVNEKQM